MEHGAKAIAWKGGGRGPMKNHQPILCPLLVVTSLAGVLPGNRNKPGGPRWSG